MHLAVPPLEEGAIHVWRAALEPARACPGILSHDERQRAARFHFERDRVRFQVCRSLLRRLVGGYTGLAPEAVTFGYGSHGKPYLEQDGALRFNVSHSHDVALLAFGRRELGVDVERIRPGVDLVGLARTCFSTAERERIFSHPPERQAEAFFEYWTAKEACIKAEGGGLSIPLQRFTIVERGELAEAEAEPGVCLGNWIVRRVAVGAGYRAAVAVQGAGWTVIQFEAQ
jgi:4'-phosphopantetheinyl transferase